MFEGRLALPPSRSVRRLFCQGDVLDLLQHSELARQLCTICLFLGSDLRLIAAERIDRGFMLRSLIDSAGVMHRAEQLDAAGFILVESMPAGRHQPDDNEIALSQRFRRTSKELGIPLLDWFILADDRLVRIGEWV